MLNIPVNSYGHVGTLGLQSDKLPTALWGPAKIICLNKMTLRIFIEEICVYCKNGGLQIRVHNGKLFFLLQPKHVLWVLNEMVLLSTQNTCLS